MIFGEKQQIITGLDIGTNFIKALVVQKGKGKELEILSQIEEPAAGIRKGVVIDVPKVSETISFILKRAEEESQRKIKSVYSNIGGSHIYCTSSRGLVSVSRADQKISEEDVNRVIQAAQTFSLSPNKEILEAFPKEFIVDSEKGIKEVLGIQGVRLEAEVLVACGFSPYLRNSTQAILDSGLQINDLILSPLASAKAVLSPREKELGVAVLDVGAGTTDLAVFEEGNLIHLAIFPIGSANITNDIAICLKTDIDTAEKIKIEYGSCPAMNERKKEKIKIEGEEPLSFSKKTLTDIIEARASEIFEQANKELKKISRQGLLPAGIVLTGGGSKLRKIRELAKKELKLPCRIGKPRRFYIQQEDPALATVCGLVLEELELEKEEKRVYDSGESFGSRIKKIFKIFVP